MLEDVLWRICLIYGRLKDCSLVAYFDNMIYVYHHALNRFKNRNIFLAVFCKLFAMCPRMCRYNFGNRLGYFFPTSEKTECRTKLLVSIDKKIFLLRLSKPWCGDIHTLAFKRCEKKCSHAEPVPLMPNRTFFSRP